MDRRALASFFLPAWLIACSGAPAPTGPLRPGARPTAAPVESAGFGPVDGPPLGVSAASVADADYPFDPFSAHRMKTPVAQPLPPGAALRLGHSVDGAYSLDQMAVSPDAKRWATCNIAHEVVLWDPAKGLPTKKLATLERENSCVKMAFSLDGSRLFVAGYDDLIALDVATGKGELWQYERGGSRGGDPFRPNDLAVGPRGGVFVAGRVKGTDGAVVWFSADGQIVRRTSGFKQDMNEVTAWAVAASADGAWVAAGGATETIVYRASTGAIEVHLASDYTHAIAFSPDSKRLYAATASAINAFDLGTREAAASYGFLGNRFWSESLAVTPDGAVLVAPTGTGVAGFDVATRKQLWSAEGSFEGRLSATSTGEVVVASERPLTIARLSAKTGARTAPYDFARHDREVLSVAFMDGDKQILTAGKDGDARVWSAVDGAPVVTFARRPSGGAARALVRPAAREVVSTASTCALYRWEPGASTILGRLSLGEQTGCFLTDMAFLSNGTLAVVDEGGSLRFVDAALARETARVALGEDVQPQALAVSPEGDRVWVLHYRGLLGIDPTKAAVVERFAFEGDEAHAFALLPGKKQAVVGCRGAALVVSLKDGKVLRTVKLTDAQWTASSVLHLPARGLVALGVRKGVLLVDPATGSIARTLTADDPYASAESLALSGDGRRLAAGFESVVLVWNL